METQAQAKQLWFHYTDEERRAYLSGDSERHFSVD